MDYVIPFIFLIIMVMLSYFDFSRGDHLGGTIKIIVGISIFFALAYLFGWWEADVAGRFGGSGAGSGTGVSRTVVRDNVATLGGTLGSSEITRAGVTSWHKPTEERSISDQKNTHLVSGEKYEDIKLFFNDNLPKAWKTMFENTMRKLGSLLGYYKINVIAWLDEPNAGQQGPDKYYENGHGQSVDNGGKVVALVLEVPRSEQPTNERPNGDPHRVAVIAHEYFHIWQVYVNPPPRGPRSMKWWMWIWEGAAALFESMYLNDYHNNPNYYKNSQNPNITGVFNNKEVYNSKSVNYGDETTMVLYLSYLVGNKDSGGGFQKILDFFKKNPSIDTWKAVFNEVFDMTVETFYGNINTFYKENGKEGFVALFPAKGTLGELDFKSTIEGFVGHSKTWEDCIYII
tara:strand:- start:1528 stop:2730 length:1203 start_codon:yes stop_codon:yes gene_type:complete